MCWVLRFPANFFSSRSCSTLAGQCSGRFRYYYHISLSNLVMFLNLTTLVFQILCYPLSSFQPKQMAYTKKSIHSRFELGVGRRMGFDAKHQNCGIEMEQWNISRLSTRRESLPKSLVSGAIWGKVQFASQTNVFAISVLPTGTIFSRQCSPLDFHCWFSLIATPPSFDVFCQRTRRQSLKHVVDTLATWNESFACLWF